MEEEVHPEGPEESSEGPNHAYPKHFRTLTGAEGFNQIFPCEKPQRFWVSQEAPEEDRDGRDSQRDQGIGSREKLMTEYVQFKTTETCRQQGHDCCCNGSRVQKNA